MASGDDGCDHALELKLRLFAERPDLFGGSRVKQEKDHVIPGYQDRANVCDMSSVEP